MAQLHPDPAGLEPIDREILGEAARHVPFIEATNRALRRVFGLGGLGVLVAAAVAPVLVAQRVEASALQLALVAFGAVIVGLGVVGVIARRARARLSRDVDGYCIDHETSRAELARIAAHRPDRWPFVRAVLREGRPLTSGPQVGEIEG